MSWSGTTSDCPPRILVVRLGSMGDVIHALPAVASLKHSFPHSHVTWVIRPRWMPLVEGNPFVDLQGLIQSALIASAAKADRIVGFHRSRVREWPAALFYSTEVATRSAH